MRIFSSVKEMYGEVKRDLKEMGIEYISETVQDQEVNIKTLELNGYGYTLTQHEDAYDTAKANGINMEWLSAENMERAGMEMLNLNPGYAWNHNKEFWEKFLRDGAFSYTYPERMYNQISRVIGELIARKNTRQAVITMYDVHQDMMNWGGRDRVPCSMHYQLLIREDKLHMSYCMRSCDLVKFFLSDVYLALGLLDHISDAIGLETGNFTHFIGSLHCFEGELEGVF